MTAPLTEDPAYEARTQIRLAVYRIAGNRGDPRHVDYDPLAALRVLVCLRAAVTQAERDAARRVREDGSTWSDIGEALGFADDPGPGMTSVAERAYQYVIPAGRAIGRDGFPWICPSCGGQVRDYGPEIPPDEAERGHAEGCERFAATMRAWDASWDDGSEEGSGDA